MLASSDSERSRLFLVAEAEIRAASLENAVAEVKETVFQYLNKKVTNLPQEIFGLSSFDHESGLFSSEHIRTDKLEIWAARLNEPDATVPGRSWSLEFLVGQSEGKATFTGRLSCFSRHLDFYFEPAVPRVYKDLVRQGYLYGDGTRLRSEPTEIADENDVDWLVALINNKNRIRNIIAVSCEHTGKSLISADVFHNRLCSVAHIVRISPTASYELSEQVGKNFSVFDCGLRLYRPTAQLESDEPTRHPLWTRHRLQQASTNNLQVFLARETFRTSVERGLRTQAVPSFVQVRSANSTLRLAEVQSAGVNADSIVRLESEINAIRAAKDAAVAEAREALDLSIQEEAARRLAEEERDAERSRSMALVARIKALESKLGSSSIPDQEYPTTYADIPEWIETQFASRLSLHTRARRALRGAEFEDVRLVCELIELLAIEFVDSKRGDREAWERFEQSLMQLGVEFSKSVTGSRAGEQGDEYFVQHRGQKRLLEDHLKKGTSRSKNKILRIYFFWDDEDEQIIVGYLPGHLDTRIT